MASDMEIKNNRMLIVKLKRCKEYKQEMVMASDMEIKNNRVLVVKLKRLKPEEYQTPKTEVKRSAKSACVRLPNEANEKGVLIIDLLDESTDDTSGLSTNIINSFSHVGQDSSTTNHVSEVQPEEDKRENVEEILERVAQETDPMLYLDDDITEFLIAYTDRYIDKTIAGAALMAAQRGSPHLVSREDVQIHLDLATESRTHLRWYLQRKGVAGQQKY